MNRYRPLSLTALLVTAVTLALVLTGISTVYRYAQAFSGDLCIAVGQGERVVVRQAQDSPFPLAGALKNVAADQIPFDNPATATKLRDGEHRYDAFVLPFSVRVTDVQVVQRPKPRDTLNVMAPGTADVIDLREGASIEIEGTSFEVAGVRKWSGLLRDRAGVRMAALALRRPEESWTEDVFLVTDTWRRVEPNIGIWFRWFESEAAAREDLEGGPPGLESARWGAVDGPAINWFASFAPGTGATFADGTRVTLVQVDEHHRTHGGEGPAIAVRVEGGAEPRTVWVPANARDPDALVRFEYCARLETVLLLDAWGEGAALVAAYHNGTACGGRVLADGEAWRPEDLPYELRLDGVLEAAVPVMREDSPLYEAVLRNGDRELRCRQGEAVRWGDALIEYVRAAPPPVVRYGLVAVPAGEDQGVAFSLGPGDVLTYRGWQLALGTPGPDPLHMAVLRAER